MHSVLVYGDVRTHQFFFEPGADKKARKAPTQYGGAIFLADAISTALDHVFPTSDLTGQNTSRPSLFTVAPRGDDEDHRDPLGFEYLDWKLERKRLSGPKASLLEEGSPESDRQFRLKLWQKRPLGDEPIAEREDSLFPDLEEKLAERLEGRAVFDPPSDNRRWCPDIVVFDDLSDYLRGISICPAGRLPSKVAVMKALKPDERKARFEEGLRTIVKRLLYAGEEIRGQPESLPLDPVIICCVGGSLPEIGVSETDWKLWDCLIRHRTLAERTIVILDVKDLREKEHLTISSGLSWERTAQDTIAELTRSRRARRLLAFSQLIIRYGATGALHIHRIGDETWTYQLFFDPECDDRTWTESDSSGEALGYPAVFAATLIQHLTQVCNLRREKPVLHDMAEAVAGSIPHAIVRCQRLLHRGYPDPNDSEFTLLPAGLFQHYPERNWISRVMVPELRSQTWSIISQGAQGRSGRVASNIVRYGVQTALNQHVPSTKAFSARWARDVVTRIWKDFNAASLSARPVRNRVNAILRQTYRNAMADDLRLPRRAAQHYDDACLDVLEPMAKVCRGFLDQVHADLRKFKLTATPRFVEAYERHERILLAELTALLVDRLRLPSRVDSRYDPISAPLALFGKKADFRLVDRREIESIRAVQKLIKAHLDGIRDDRDPTHHKPLSIAVFGPPGSGKSTAVKKIVEELEGHETKTEILKDPFNLAQFTKSDDLDHAFDEILNGAAEHKVPIAFFDEFDTRFQNEEWGWLKFFLSPMEDGLYRGKPVHTSIFVFAGGTSGTYSQFSLENRPSTDPQVQAFGRAKGPDFVSRLRGYLNVVGVNPSDSDDELYLIRRAIVIRNILEKIQGLGADEEARIDPDMLRATLFVPQYRNNARSIRTLLEMCSRSDRRTISNSSLPLIHQLNMLTDGKAFLDLLADVSANPDDGT